MSKQTIFIIISFLVLAGFVGSGVSIWQRKYPEKPSELPENNSKQEQTISGQSATTTEPGKTQPVIIKDEPIFTMSSFQHLDTTDWLTYKADEGFYIQYPSDWEIEKREIMPLYCSEREETKTKCQEEYLQRTRMAKIYYSLLGFCLCRFKGIARSQDSFVIQR